MSRIDGALERGREFTGVKPFRSNGVYDKLALLTAVTSAVAIFSYRAVGANSGLRALVMPAMLVALGASLVGQFKPNLAKICAPVYAVFQGVVLGVVSKAYGTYGNGIVRSALAATVVLFVACLLVFRSGIVKVTPKFAQVVGILGLTLFGMYMLSMVGLSIPGINEIGPKGIIFGVLGLGIGLSYLFIDFDRVQRAQSNELPIHNTAEWFLAFQLLLSLVMVYMNVLRILASMNRR